MALAARAGTDRCRGERKRERGERSLGADRAGQSRGSGRQRGHVFARKSKSEQQTNKARENLSLAESK
ncbi:hypothetical protein E2C01_055952 [Portunus trituberculatus]|uniref:Uncharacterized protein n=1 Tax=Portunus trituberculatus TaxID=210409 RepID=A0A5B7GWY0_PORTR|nr:hypothetical protein [Portunus trituberculatus]